MPTTTWSVLPRYSVLLALALAACAGPQEQQSRPEAPGAARGELGALPATFRNAPSCGGCLAVTVTLRPDGAYVAREKLGASEFYDFGRWQTADGTLRLAGGRDEPRSYALRPGGVLDAQAGTQGGDLRRAPEVESLRGPFRMTGLYDGERFKECQTGVAWALDDSRAAQALKEEFSGRKNRAMLVSIDARFEPQPPRGEALRVVRTAAIHNERGCPG
jgi:hypothetical protein